jgi:hypothetical protein
MKLEVKLEVGVINVHLVGSEDAIRLDGKLDKILAKLQTIERKEVIIMADLTALKESVGHIKDTGDSMKALMIGLAAKVEENKTDPVALQAIADDLRGKATEWAEAVTTYTPAA